jgi:hypothetical protein
LARAALRSRLAEAGGQDDERAHALGGTSARCVEHGGSGDGDDGELDRTRDVGQPLEGPQLGDGPGVGVDRVDRPGEARRDEVAHDGAADGPQPPRGADDGDRRGREHVPDGRHRGEAVALLEAGARGRAQLRRQLDYERLGLGVHLGREARIAQHAQHPVVAGMHQRGQRRDAGRLGELSQVRQQDRGDPLALPVVGHGEGELRALGGFAHEDRVGDDRVSRARCRHEAGAAPQQLARRRFRIEARAEEAEPARLQRQPAHERDQSVAVRRAGSPYVDGRAVAESDVDPLRDGPPLLLEHRAAGRRSGKRGRVHECRTRVSDGASAASVKTRRRSAGPSRWPAQRSPVRWASPLGSAPQ